MSEINFYIDSSIEGWTATVLNIPKDGKNHDVWNINHNSVIVADGATPLHSYWAQDLNQWGKTLTALMCEYAKAPEISLHQAWDEAIMTNNSVFPPKGVERTAGLSHVRISNTIDTLTVGDIKLALLMSDGKFDTIFDSKLSHFEEIEDAKIASGEITPQQAAEANRAKVNIPGGYYAVADDPTVGSQAISHSMPADTVQSLIIASDGFWRLFDSDSDMFEATGTDDLEEIMLNIQNAGEMTDDLTFIRIDKNQ